MTNITELKNGPIYPEGPLYGDVLAAQTPQELRQILASDVHNRAEVFADEHHPFDPEEPFIIYRPMNRLPELGTGLATIKLAMMEMHLDPNEPYLLLFAPQSASWMAEVIRYSNILPNSEILWATKNFDKIRLQADVVTVMTRSYTQNRQPDGSRSHVPLYIVNPGQIIDRRIVGFDDVLAEGFTPQDITTALKWLGAGQIDWAVTLSKGRIQGGTNRVTESGLVSNLVEAIQVQQVHGPGYGQIELVNGH